MRTVGNFNNISTELKNQLKQLKPGKFVELQQFEVRRSQDPDTKEVLTVYPPQHLWLKDQITDPFTGNIVDIGVFKTIDAKNETVTQYHDIDLEARMNGRHFLDGNVALHREIYEFVQLCNFCENSLLIEQVIDGKKVNYRDASKQLILKIVDNKADARTKNEFYDAKAEALNFIQKMKLSDMREFCAAKNWNYTDDDLISMKIREYADKYPVEFKKEMEDPRTRRKAFIKFALESGALVFNPEAFSISWPNGEGVIATLERQEGKTHIDQFCEWTYTVANGEKVIAEIRKKMPKEEMA